MLKKRTLLLLGLLAAIAQPAHATKMNELYWTFESYLFGEQQDVAESTVNPRNLVMGLPLTTYTLDNRLEMKWLLNDAKIIARPRWTLYQDEFKNEVTGEKKTRAMGKLDISDAFVEQALTRKASVTLGLQVFQWGPGELFNPSNPFFRFNNRQQTYTYKEKGKSLVRFNYSFNMERSLILIAEPVSNNEPFWMAEKEFKPEFVIKFERNWKNTRNYYGLLAGSEAQNNPFVGEYAHYELKPGWSLYLDAKHSYELQSYRPEKNLLGSYDMNLTGEKSKEWSHLGLFGFRYEGDVDFRIEYLYNSLGYSKDEFDNAVLSASNFFSTQYAQNATRFLNSGLNLMTQHYLYLSLRVMDPGSIKDVNFFLRGLASATDSSGLGQFEFDKSVGDAFVVYGSYTSFFGKENSEFKLLDDWRALVGLKYTL